MKGIMFMYKHPKSEEVLISREYTAKELVDKYDEEIHENTCHCDCEPIGETNVVECNCDDYYQDFELEGNSFDNPELLIEELKE